MRTTFPSPSDGRPARYALGGADCPGAGEQAIIRELPAYLLDIQPS